MEFGKCIVVHIYQECYCTKMKSEINIVYARHYTVQ